MYIKPSSRVDSFNWMSSGLDLLRGHRTTATMTWSTRKVSNYPKPNGVFHIYVKPNGWQRGLCIELC